MNNRLGSIPFGVLLIVVFYAFGALVLLTFLFINPGQTAHVLLERHSLPTATGNWIVPITAGLALLISYGLFSLSRWGYVLTMLYQIYFAGANLFLFIMQADLVFLGSLLWSILVIVYLLIVRKRFFGGLPSGQGIRTNEPGQI